MPSRSRQALCTASQHIVVAGMWGFERHHLGVQLADWMPLDTMGPAAQTCDLCLSSGGSGVLSTPAARDAASSMAALDALDAAAAKLLQSRSVNSNHMAAVLQVPSLRYR